MWLLLAERFLTFDDQGAFILKGLLVLLGSDEEDITVFWNIGNHVPSDIVLHARIHNIGNHVPSDSVTCQDT